MSTAKDIYDHAQSLMKIAQRCRDDTASEQVRRIARELLEIAYQQDGVIDWQPAAARR